MEEVRSETGNPSIFVVPGQRIRLGSYLSVNTVVVSKPFFFFFFNKSHSRELREFTL